MKFTIDTKALKDTKKNFDKIIEKKINHYIKISTKNNLLQLEGTNLQSYLKSTIDCETIVSGECFVNNDQLENILENYKNKTITCELENDFLKIIEDKTIYKIRFISQGFVEPEALSLNYKKVCEINNLKEAIDLTEFAIPKDETRYYLNGLFLDINEDYKRMVVTDGHRLIYKNISIENYNLEKFTEILPKQAINLLKNNLLTTDKVEIFLGDKFIKNQKTIKMIYRNNEFYSNLIDGDFPQYQRVLPKENNIEIEISKKELLGSIKKILGFLKSDKWNKGKDCQFDFNFINQKLKLSKSKDGLFIEDFIDFKSDYNLELINSGFNLAYLLEIIQAQQQDNVILKLKDGTSPMAIGDNDYYSVIMPE